MPKIGPQSALRPRPLLGFAGFRRPCPPQKDPSDRIADLHAVALALYPIEPLSARAAARALTEPCSGSVRARATGLMVWTPPRRPQRARVGVLEPTPGGVHEPG